jgi:hypothetical protein
VKIYYNGDAPNLSISACPAGHLPAVECPREWFEEDGTTPRTFTVLFRAGEAIVDAPLGRYLAAQNIARTTKIIMPGHLRPALA